MIPKSKWVWYGYAGHLIVSKYCAFHLSTRIGNYLVSTVGDYYPPDGGGERETIGIGKDHWFETFVFQCDGEDDHGNPFIISFSELWSKRYAKSIDAEQSHRRICDLVALNDDLKMLEEALL